MEQITINRVGALAVNSPKLHYVDKVKYNEVLSEKMHVKESFVYKGYMIPETLCEGFVVVGKTNSGIRDEHGFLEEKEVADAYITPIWDTVGIKLVDTVKYENSAEAYYRLQECKTLNHRIKLANKVDGFVGGWVCADCGKWYQVHKYDINTLRNFLWYIYKENVSAKVSDKKFDDKYDYLGHDYGVVDIDDMDKMVERWDKCVKDLHVMTRDVAQKALRFGYICEDCRTIYKSSIIKTITGRAFVRHLVLDEDIKKIVYDLKRNRDLYNVTQMGSVDQEDEHTQKEKKEFFEEYEERIFDRFDVMLERWTECVGNHVNSVDPSYDGSMCGWSCSGCKVLFRISENSLRGIVDFVNFFEFTNMDDDPENSKIKTLLNLDWTTVESTLNRLDESTIDVNASPQPLNPLAQTMNRSTRFS